jgi:hypothetical protein
MNGCEYMADKIEMQIEVMGEMVTNFRNVCRQIDDVRQEMIRLAMALEESFVSECSLPIQFDISYIISTANKLSEWSYSLSSRLNKAKNAFINADNAAGSLIRSVGISSGITSSLYRGESAAEKLAKYKSISILTTKKKTGFWGDNVPPLAKYGIGIVPSSSTMISNILEIFNKNSQLLQSDILGGFLSGLGISLSGTVIGHSNVILKKLLAEIDKDGLITTIYGNNISATYAPYKKIAKFGDILGKDAARFLLGADILNTWTDYSGNTNLKRFEKTLIQGTGAGIEKEVGFGTGAMAIMGMSNTGNKGKIWLTGAAAIDVGVGAGVTYTEDKLYKLLDIK